MSATWHAAPEVLDRYAAEDLNDVHASSLEAHLLRCAHCRSSLSARAQSPRLEAVWTGIEDALDAPRPGVVERLLLRVGVRGHVARLLAATPSLRLSWILAEAIALGTAAIAAQGAAGTNRAGASLFLFLMLAAVAPVAGVAAAFGPGVDPTYEIGIAAPMRSDRLLFIRATAVLCASLVIAGVAAVALPRSDWTVTVWLVPAFGLTLATLALATWVRPIAAAVVVGLGWVLLAAAASIASTDPLAAFHAGSQLLFLGLIAGSVVVLARRHAAYEGRIPT
ncbi:MAG: zf-HC2 domain-containing protein [Actinomycetota bacterium]